MDLESNVRARALSWLDRSGHRQGTRAYASKLHVSGSWAGRPAWWFEVPLAAVRGEGDLSFLGCTGDDAVPFVHLRCPSSFLQENIAALATREAANRLSLFLAATGPDRFTELRGRGKVDFAGFVVGIAAEARVVVGSGAPAVRPESPQAGKPPPGFRPPKAISVAGRTSTISNSFVNGIVPYFMPTAEEVEQALNVLGMTADDVRCSYCGDRASEWDHLRPLVSGKEATGHITEIANLVPACGKCNQSKGAQHWRAWMTGDARQSPATRQVPDLEARVRRLEIYEARFKARHVKLDELVGADLMLRHRTNRDQLLRLMHESEVLAREIRKLAQAKCQ